MIGEVVTWIYKVKMVRAFQQGVWKVMSLTPVAGSENSFFRFLALIALFHYFDNHDHLLCRNE